MMGADVITFPAIHSLNDFPAAEKPATESPITQTRRIAVDQSLTRENWKRLEQMAWAQGIPLAKVMASIVGNYLDAVAEQEGA